ncbi:MAG: 50S ribosomal protein L21e [Candidatus Woesearchaeota archaeon]
MVQRTGGMRRKTRQKLSKNARTKGKISIRDSLQTFNTGDVVILKAEPAVQDGMYFPRFHGKQGVIKAEQGACYQVEILDGKNKKIVIVHPVHLQKRR